VCEMGAGCYTSMSCGDEGSTRAPLSVRELRQWWDRGMGRSIWAVAGAGCRRSSVNPPPFVFVRTFTFTYSILLLLFFQLYNLRNFTRLIITAVGHVQGSDSGGTLSCSVPSVLGQIK
jgi:hypothetical protein